MNLKSLSAAVMGMVLGGTASAQGVFTTTGNNSAWRNAATWSHVGSPALSYPSAGDAVIIHHSVTVSNAESVADVMIDSSATPTVTFSSGSLACGPLLVTDNSTLTIAGSGPWTASDIEIDSGSVLDIEANNTLTMEDVGYGVVDGTLDINGGTFVVDGSSAQALIGSGGVIRMRGNTPILTVDPTDGVVLNASSALIKVDNDYSVGGYAVINGAGSVLGTVPGDTIQINCSQSGDTKLKLDGATLHGVLTIRQGAGAGKSYFENRGVVVADASGQEIYLHESLGCVTDSASKCAHPRWRAEGQGSSTRLHFGVSATTLQAAFTVNGTLCIECTATVVTSGGLNLGMYGVITCGGTFSHGTCP